MYEREDHPVPDIQEVDSEKTHLPSSMILVREARSETATRSGAGEEDKMRGVETKKVNKEEVKW